MAYIKPEPEPEPEPEPKLEPTISHPIPTMTNFHPIPPSQIAAAPDPTTTLRPSEEKKTTPLPLPPSPPPTAEEMVTHITSPPTAKQPNEQTRRNPSSRPVVVTRDPVDGNGRSVKDIGNREGRGRRLSQGRGGVLGDGGGGWGMKDGNSRNTVDGGKAVNVDIGQQHPVVNDGQGGVRKEGSQNPERGGVVKREEEEEAAAAAAAGENLRGTALLQSAALQSHLKLKSATKRKRTITDQGGTMNSQLPSSSATITSSTQHPLATRTAGDTSLRPQRPAIAKKPARKNARHVTSQVVETRTTKHVSAWYDAVDMKAKYSRSDLENLRVLITLQRKCTEAAKSHSIEDVKKYHSELRNRLHQMEFYDFLSGVLIRKSRILEEEGLPAIFDAPPGRYPWDIRADSRMLYHRWAVGQLDPHLLRGIEDKKVTHSDGKTFKSRRFATDYRGRVSSNYVGEGQLTNGQWWPLQICAMRDGAHGETEAGIYGQAGFGAYSIVVSDGGYHNVDRGTHLEYCGTAGADGEASTGTKLLKESFALGQPLRVLRSSHLALGNPYRPAKGLRYDGLYEIRGFEILEARTAMHRFSLERCAGQDPIRYRDVYARPTAEELAAYAKVRVLLGFRS